jgi:hypothetical protein
MLKTRTIIVHTRLDFLISVIIGWGGLQLWLYPVGANPWRLAYRFDDKHRVQVIGVYPTVLLK